ncbi:MAG: heat-inducible transcriptional repressor HrcA [Acidobacteria bacterium]|nr:heat-inducible transcriptional repressor HrcA [Acidobacteriota bacterium]
MKHTAAERRASNSTQKMSVRENYHKIESDLNFPDSRGRRVLSAVIDEHFLTGEPVGSKSISEKFAGASGLSSASIRGVMGELEELGLLEQPHTSAGRIPTDKGYRFFVDNLLGVLSISNDDLRRIGGEFGFSESDLTEAPDRLLQRTSQLLSALSNNVGIVVSPSLASDRLQHVILCSQSIEDESDLQGEVFVEGASNILTKRDFADLERLRGLLSMIGEKTRLLQILNECVRRDQDTPGAVQVVIGKENSVASLQNCTLISTPYRIAGGPAIGSLSVLGPTRIEYARTISIVSYVARVLEKMMSKRDAAI